MALHQELSGSEVHTPFTFVYANEAARTGATGLISSDVNKLALQVDDYTVWILTDSSGPTWAPVSPTASEILTKLKTVDGDGSGLDADTVDGYHVGLGVGTIPPLRSDGVIELGQYIDLHYDNDFSSDYTCRLESDASGNLCVNGAVAGVAGDFPPKPQSASGVGQWVRIHRNSTSAGYYELPEGGTWVYFIVVFRDDDDDPVGEFSNTISGIAAGGTENIVSGSRQYSGFAWRIA